MKRINKIINKKWLWVSLGLLLFLGVLLYFNLELHKLKQFNLSIQEEHNLQLNEIKKLNSDLSDNISLIEKNRLDLLEKIAQMEKNNNDLQGKIQQAEELNQKLQTEAQQLQATIQELQQKINSLEKERAELLRQLSAKKRSQTAPPKEFARGEKVAYLTFDDGPSANTVKILNILDTYQVKATFFVIGDTTSFARNIYQRIVKSGHALGNHSYSHQYKQIYQSSTAFKADFNRLQDLLVKTTGVKPRIMRFPGGSRNGIASQQVMKQIAREMSQAGYVYIDWNIDSQDAAKKTNTKAAIVNAVLTNAQGKNSIIVLMHDTLPKTTTVEALPEIITGLRKQGFQFQRLTPHSFRVQFLRP